MTEDERVERVLKALTQVEVPEGMEERVLRRLQGHRVKVATGRRWLVLACAAGACAVVALAVGMRHRVASPAVVAPMVGKVALPNPIEHHAAQASVPGASHTRIAKPSRAVAMEASFPASAAPLTEQEKLLVRLVRARESEQSRAVAALREPKETDVPLTHEEVLLVAVSRVRQDAVLEALDPVRRAETNEREKREFNAYVQQKDGGS